MEKYTITKEVIMEEVRNNARKNGWELNPDSKSVKRVCNGIFRNFIKYGYKYCPCVMITVIAEERRKDYICPCVNAKDEVEKDGQCHCSLYFKKEESP